MKTNKELYKEMIYNFYNGAKTLHEKLNAVQPHIRNMDKETLEVLYMDLIETANPKTKEDKKPEKKKTPKAVSDGKPTILSDLKNE